MDTGMNLLHIRYPGLQAYKLIAYDKRLQLEFALQFSCTFISPLTTVLLVAFVCSIPKLTGRRDRLRDVQPVRRHFYLSGNGPLIYKLYSRGISIHGIRRLITDAIAQASNPHTAANPTTKIETAPALPFHISAPEVKPADAVCTAQLPSVVVANTGGSLDAAPDAV